MSKQKKQLLSFLFSALILVFIDQVTKILAKSFLEGQPDLVIIDHVFVLRYLENRGAAFGIMQGGFLFFYILTAVVLIGILVVLRRIPVTRRFLPLRIGLLLLFSGALGNLIDRIFRGYVVDFFYFILIDFPIFNVADCYVTISAIGLILLIFFYYSEEEYNAIFHIGKKREGEKS